MRVEELKKNELDRVIDLFCLVWGDKYSIVEAKTKWVFENPFSKVLVMKDQNDNIIAVRGGIEWSLQYKGEAIKAIQFHGTCVHPDYRRKGFFSLINKSFVSLVKENGFELIFNVSVKASKLGYEKLGWVYLKGFHRLTKIHTFNYLRRKKQESISKYLYNPVNHYVSSELIKIRNKQFDSSIYTKYSKEFMDWRLSNKQAGYCLFTFNGSSIVFKVVDKGNRRELIIGDFFLAELNFSHFKKILKTLFRKVKPNLTTTYISEKHPCYRYYLMSLFFPNPLNYHLNFGIREIDKNINISDETWGSSFLDIDTF